MAAATHAAHGAGSGDSEFVLRAAGLRKRYGTLTAVDGLSLEVRRGEVLGFLGPNGAGKTTTLKMMCGLLRPDAGSVEIEGRPVRAGDPRTSGAIGVSPQNIVVWEMLTCAEQLEFMGVMYGMGRWAAAARTRELLAAFGLEEKSRRLARTLSGGMQRRLNIALALVHGPKVLFLDEPQAGLDPQSRVLVRDYVRALRGRMTVVVTTHDMEEAEKLADRVCIVDRGRLLALDTVEGVKGLLSGGDVFEIELGGEGGDAAARLAPLLDPSVRESAARSSRGALLTFASPRGAELLPGVLDAIRGSGLRVESLRMRKTTLEDVFIALTGRGLRE